MRLSPASAKQRIGAQVLQVPEPDCRPDNPGLVPWFCPVRLNLRAHGTEFIKWVLSGLSFPSLLSSFLSPCLAAYHLLSTFYGLQNEDLAAHGLVFLHHIRVLNLMLS